MATKRMSNDEKEAAIVGALSELDNDTTYDALLDKLTADGNETAMTYLFELKRRGVLNAAVKATGIDTRAEFRIWKGAE